MPETEVLTGKRARKAAKKAEREAPEPPPEPKPAKHRAASSRDVPKAVSFFQRMASFPKEDWGTRVKVKVYRLKPHTDLVAATGFKYCCIYDTFPPPDEERIKHDCGSGKYRLYLNYKAPADDEKELDSTEIDILDMKYPPLIPKGAWLDDPRNQGWEWAREAYEEKERQAKAAKEAERQAAAQPDAKKYLTDALELADKVRGPQPERRSPVDDLNVLVAVAEKLKPSDTLPALITQFTASLNAQIEASNKRADAFLQRLLDRENKADNSGGIKGIVTAVKDLEPLLEKFFPWLVSKAGDVLGGAATHSRMTGWQEFALGLAPQAAEILKPFSMLFAEVIASRAIQTARPAVEQPAALPAPAGNPGTPATAAPQNASVMGFLGMLANPMLAKVRLAGPPENIDPAELGDEFGSWVLEGYGVDPQYPDAIKLARAFGPAGIIAQFRSDARIWNQKGRDGKQLSLAELEPKLTPFFQAFLDYKPAEEPDGDEEPQPDDPAQPDVVNFDEEYANA